MADNRPKNEGKEEKPLGDWIEEVFGPLKDIIYNLLSNISDVIEEVE
jgi:hypothetical protein